MLTNLDRERISQAQLQQKIFEQTRGWVLKENDGDGRAFVITRPRCHKCLNMRRSDQSGGFYSPCPICSHTFLPQNHTFTLQQWGPPCWHQHQTAGILTEKKKKTHLTKAKEQNCYFTNHHFKNRNQIGKKKSSQITANSFPAGHGPHHR